MDMVQQQYRHNHGMVQQQYCLVRYGAAAVVGITMDMVQQHYSLLQYGAAAVVGITMDMVQQQLA